MINFRSQFSDTNISVLRLTITLFQSVLLSNERTVTTRRYLTRVWTKFVD